MTSLAFTPAEAEQIEQDLLAAPGAQAPDSTRRPVRPAQKTTDKHVELDAQVKACNWCGAGTFHALCDHCNTHGYPSTDRQVAAYG